MGPATPTPGKTLLSPPDHILIIPRLCGNPDKPLAKRA